MFPSADVHREAPPAAVENVFGARAGLVERFADLLATEGVVRGLIGPREAPRLWDRHLLNCAVIHEAVPAGARVCDVGSGAGLPGLVLTIVRPDLRVTLLEPLLRRTTFLEEAVTALGLDDVEVVRGRAEEHARRHPAYDVVVSRAVARLDRLAGWCLPLARRDGEMLAMKGSSAQQEVDEARAALSRAGGRDPRVEEYGAGVLDQPTTVVRVTRQ